MNRLHCAIPLVAFVVSSFISCKSVNPQPRPDSSHRFVHLAEGDYLSTDYIEELRKTRSPLRAGSAGGVELVRVRHDAKQFVLEPIINFHEGDSGVALNQDGSPVSDATDVSNVSAIVVDDHTIRFGYGTFNPANYAFVSDASGYVSRVVLVGKYRDERGRSYEFQENGWAVFPDRKFEFEIGVDHVLDNFDYFMDAGQDKKQLPWAVWAFKWNRNRLEIYRTKDMGGVDEITGAKPVFVLSPVVQNSGLVALN